MNKITALFLLLLGMLTENCIVSAAHTDKTTRNLRGWDQEQEFISREWAGDNPVECATANPFFSCGRGEKCWRTYRNGNWKGNGICVPNDQCLPTNTWALTSAVRPSRMRRECCNGAQCTNANYAKFHNYCICQ